MNDQLLLNNYLLVLKSTVEVFVHGTLESSNKKIRDILKEGLDDTMSSQADTYDIMTQYGYYTVNNINNKEIKKVYKKVNNN